MKPLVKPFEIKRKPSLDYIWNDAVSQVGGMRNTLANFNVIVGRFIVLCAQDKVPVDEAKAFVKEQHQACFTFFEVD